MGYLQRCRDEYHWTPRQAMHEQTFSQMVAVLIGEPRTTSVTYTNPVSAAGDMQSLREQINRKRAAKGLPAMKPTPRR